LGFLRLKQIAEGLGDPLVIPVGGGAELDGVEAAVVGKGLALVAGDLELGDQGAGLGALFGGEGLGDVRGACQVRR
jgi:hypothetical protein